MAYNPQLLNLNPSLSGPWGHEASAGGGSAILARPLLGAEQAFSFSSSRSPLRLAE